MASSFFVKKSKVSITYLANTKTSSRKIIKTDHQETLLKLVPTKISHFYLKNKLYVVQAKFMTRNFSLVARYSLKFTRYLLLVGKSLRAHCKICLLLVAEVARCKKSLAYSLQKLLLTKNHSLLNMKFARYTLQKLFVPKTHSLLI